MGHLFINIFRSTLFYIKEVSYFNRGKGVTVKKLLSFVLLCCLIVHPATASSGVVAQSWWSRITTACSQKLRAVPAILSNSLQKIKSVQWADALIVGGSLAIAATATVGIGYGLYALWKKLAASSKKDGSYPPPPPPDNRSINGDQEFDWEEEFVCPEEIKDTKPEFLTKLPKIDIFSNMSGHVDHPRNIERGQSKIKVQQLKVAYQSGAQCALHSIKNAAGILGMIQGNADARSILVDSTASRQIIERLSKLAGLNNQKKSLSDYCLSRLEAVTADPVDGDLYRPATLQSVFQNFLRHYTNHLANEIINNKESAKNLTKDAIMREMAGLRFEISDGTVKRNNNDYGTNYTIQQVNEFINNPDNIGRFIQFKRGFSALDVSKANINVASDLSGGNWLHGNDMDQIIRELRAKEGADQLKNLLNSPRALEVVDVDALKLLKKMENIRGLKESIEAGKAQDGHYGFLVGTMPNSNNTGSRGHWMAVVLEVHGNERRYTIADSLNGPRLRGGPCATLINYLEGQEVL